MKEVRLFFRFVMPGLIFAIIFAVTLGILRFDMVEAAVISDAAKGIGTALATILASGGGCPRDR